MRCLMTGQFATVVAVSLCLLEARGEDLNDAWSQAIGLNAGLQARGLDTSAAGMNLRAARSRGCRSVSLTSLTAFLSQSPQIRVPASLAAAGAGAAAFKGAFPALAPINPLSPSYLPISASLSIRADEFAITSRRRPRASGIRRPRNSARSSTSS